MDAPFFRGPAGEPVPQVAPEDIKAVYGVCEDVARRHPGEQVGIGKGIFEHACKPGANVAAVVYRAGMLRILVQHGDENLTAWMNRGEPGDALFRAAAQIPMEWIGVGVDHEGLPFDVDDLLRRLQGPH
jgi:hypothetical protein